MNKQTTIFEGDVYVKASQDPTVYGPGNLYIDGTFTYLTSNSLSVNITGTADSTNASTGGALTDLGGAGIAKSLYVGTNLYVQNVNLTPNPYDIFSQQTFNALNNQTIPANITGFNVTNNVRFFQALISVNINATPSNLIAGYTLEGIQIDNSGTWQLNTTFIGQNTNIKFFITNAGQIQYTSTNIAGYISSTIKYRVTTITT